MKKPKRTKKQYTDLFINPQALFGEVETILWPNGVPEIWFKDKKGCGFRIQVSSGKAGLSLTVSRFVGTPALSMSGNQADTEWTPFVGPDMQEIGLTQYRADAYSQAFKQWYQADSESRETLKHPDEMGMLPVK
jgi:hypothetical protein